RDASLAPLEAYQRGWPRAHPVGKPFRAEAAVTRALPHRGEAELQRRDASPCVEEIAALQMLEFRRTRRVVGHNHADVASTERDPQHLTSGLAANRRRA